MYEWDCTMITSVRNSLAVKLLRLTIIFLVIAIAIGCSRGKKDLKPATYNQEAIKYEESRPEKELVEDRPSKPEDYSIRKIRSSEKVLREYKKVHRGALPKKPIIYKYCIRANPEEKFVAGAASELISSFDIISRLRNVPQVEEEITIFAPNGTRLGPRKHLYTEIDGVGGYEVRHIINIPKGCPN